MSGELLPLPAKLTAHRIAAASPEQRAAWLAEADATAPARAARMRETLSFLEAPKAADPAVVPLPVGEQRKMMADLYERWKDAQIAAGRETCEHGEALTRTCLVCFDGRVWERAAAESTPKLAAGDADKCAHGFTDDVPCPKCKAIEEATYEVAEIIVMAGCTDDEEAHEEAERLVGIVSDAVRFTDAREETREEAQAMAALAPAGPWLAHLPPADVAADIDGATPVVVPSRLALPDGRELPAGEIDLRVEDMAKDLTKLAARVSALEQRPPVIAPPAIPANIAEQIAIAEGKAETARRAVEALTAQLKPVIAEAEERARKDARDEADARGAAQFRREMEARLDAALKRGPSEHFIDASAHPALVEALRKMPSGEIREAAPASPVRVLRCSSLPLFRACAASMDRTPEMILVESTGEPARLGTAVHEVAAHMIRHGREAAQGIVADVAARHDVDAEDLGYLAYQAAEAWSAIGDRFGRETTTEEAMDVSLGSATLTGHPDLYALAGRTLRVLDWKSGRARYDAREQLLGYAWLCLSDYVEGTIDTVELYAVWLRPEHGGIQRLVYSADEVRAWRDDTARRATATPLPYSPGPHCVQCSRCADCPAKAAWVRQTVAEFAPGGTTAEALAQARTVGKLAAQAVEAIRTQATTAGIEGVKVTEERRVSVRLSHPAVPQAIREALGSEATAAGGKVRGAMLKVMGLKGADADEEMSRLEAAGAAKVTVSKKVAGEE